MVVVKGAPEEVLARCTAVEMEDGAVTSLVPDIRTRMENLHASRAAEGFRLLAVAWKAAPLGRKVLDAADERDLVFAGYCVFLDPPKNSATEVITSLRTLGVTVKIISGDAEAVVRHLVAVLRLPSRGLLTGAQINELTDLALANRVDEVDLFARVSPDQKTRVVKALQTRGHVVGFLGDGINDAPAIRAADVGLSVDGATDVAREAADMILLEHGLEVLCEGVEEGRRTYANIMKYIRMGTSSNFGNMLSMAFASLFLPFLPLTPIQVLVNNLLYDLSETGIPFDTVDAPELAAPHTLDMREVLRFTFVMGPLSSLFDVATFALLRLWFRCGCRGVPDRVVPRIHGNADPGDFPNSYRQAGLDEYPAPFPRCNLTFRTRFCASPDGHAVRSIPWLCPPTVHDPRSHRGVGNRLSCWRRRLDAAVRAAGVADRVTIVRAAAGDAAGERSLLVSAPGQSSHHAWLMPPGHATGPLEVVEHVRVVRVDDVPRRGRVSFMKIDVEGAESLALAGASALLASDRPVLLVDLHPHLMPIVSGESPGDLIARLRAFGYRCHLLGAGVPSTAIDDTPSTAVTPVVFLPDALDSRTPPNPGR